MRLVIHDFIGHAFPVQLSRELAQRGHQVLHLHFPPFETPKGPLARAPNDPPNLEIRGLQIRGKYQKYSYVKRYFQDAEYSAVCQEAIRSFRPDVVLSGQAPPTIQSKIQFFCRQTGIRFVNWVQDFHGIAIGNLLTKKYGLPGRLLGYYFRGMDNRVLRRSDQVVFITEDFQDLCCHLPHNPGDWHTVENWAPLEELPIRPRQNPWSDTHGLSGQITFLYAGTLGLKHNPALLLGLAEHYRKRSDITIVVVSEGIGRQWLASRKAEMGLDNLRLMDFQPFSSLPDVIASADILVGIVEPEASQYCVPSKVLTYLCSSRPLLLAMPRSNLAARLILESKSGIVVEPNDPGAFLLGADRLLCDPDLRVGMAYNGRKYAEKTFDIRRVATRFEDIFWRALADPS